MTENAKKRVKLLTLKWHRKEENFFTYQFRSLKCIRFVENNFFVANNREGGGEEFETLLPFWAPGHLDWTKLAQCTTRSCILQNKTIMRHILGLFWLSSFVGSHGVRTGPKLHMHNYSMVPTTWDHYRSLRYLVTEEMDEKDLVYGRTDGRKGNTRAKNVLFVYLKHNWTVVLTCWRIHILKPHGNNVFG